MIPHSVLIQGAGAVGGTLAAALHAAGWIVRLRTRDGSAAACAQHGQRITGAAGDTWLPPTCFAPSDGERFALVLLAVKAPDLAAALRRVVADDDGVRTYITLQNGLDAPAQAAAEFGHARVLAGTAVVNARLDVQSDGVRTVTMTSPLRQLALAPLRTEHLSRAQTIAAALNTAGIQTTAHVDARALLWHKFLGLEPLATACALTGHTLGMLRADPGAFGVLRGLFGETAALALAERAIDEPRLTARWQAYLTGPPGMQPSLATDLLRGLATEHTELSALTGAVVERAAANHVAVPLHRVALAALRQVPRRKAGSVAELLVTGTPCAQPRSNSNAIGDSAMAASTPRLTVRTLRAQDVKAVDALRIASYGRATWFTLTDGERIRCERDAPGSQVTVVFDNECPVATICQTPVANRVEAEALLELDAPVIDADFPALVISRAATAEGYGGLRLNHLLRWYTLKAAVAGGLRAILGGHALGTPNLPVMEQLGYQLRKTQASSMSQVQVNTEHVMSYLPAVDFAAAQARLLPLIEPALTQSLWVGPELDLRLAERAAE